MEQSLKQDPCEDEMTRFWEILAKGCLRGKNLIELLTEARDALDDGTMRRAVEAIILQVNEGMSLSKAMAMHPDVFSRAHVAFVEGGERIGMMEKAFMIILEATWRCPACANLRNQRTLPGR